MHHQTFKYTDFSQILLLLSNILQCIRNLTFDAYDMLTKKLTISPLAMYLFTNDSYMHAYM